MAFSRAFTASVLFLSFLLLHLAYANQLMGMMSGAESPVPEAPTTPPIDCGEACKVRCGLSSRPNLCNRACGSCCAECDCVPPGTSGNYDSCPCYFRLTTRNKIRKCP
ncbi:unnamed protein product [Camellia sinensis]